MSENHRRYWINLHKYEKDSKKLYLKFLLKLIRWNRLPKKIRDNGYEELLSFLMEKEYSYNGLWSMYDMNIYEYGTLIRKKFNEEMGEDIIDPSFSSVMDVFVYTVVYASDLPGSYTEFAHNQTKADEKAFHPEALFFEMLMNLGLDYYDNENFDPFQVDYILDVWMHRDYRKNSWGSPFPLDKTKFFEYNGMKVDDFRDAGYMTLLNLYTDENWNRYRDYIRKPNFYDYFKFKEQKTGYHFAMEKAKKLKRRNYYGVNVY